MARTFDQRVDYARRAFLRDEDSRSFDNCFEEWDGSLVVTALMRLAATDAELKQAIERKFRTAGTDQWQGTADSYAAIPTARLARAAAELRKREIANAADRAAQRLAEAKAAYATEPTAIGPQYVIPGCEKDRSKGPRQMDLF